MFVFESEDERLDLIASGIARDDDLFIHTGVKRGENSYAGRGGRR